MQRLGIRHSRRSSSVIRRTTWKSSGTRWCANSAIEWFEPYSQVLDASRGVEWARWFTGGKLNIAWNCLDRHAGGAARRPAGRHLGRRRRRHPHASPSAELRRETDRLANALRGLGLAPGDRVALYMPMVPEVVMILYACFKLGLIAVPIFSGFGYGAAAVRLQDSGAKVLFTADFLERRGRQYPVEGESRRSAGPGLRRSKRWWSCATRAATSPGPTAATSGGTISSPASRSSAPPCRSIPKRPPCCFTPPEPPAGPRAPSTRTPARWPRPPRKSISPSITSRTTASGGSPISAG